MDETAQRHASVDANIILVDASNQLMFLWCDVLMV
jgi:hypothetical protein